jgi:hypothetical protein
MSLIPQLPRRLVSRGRNLSVPTFCRRNENPSVILRDARRNDDAVVELDGNDARPIQRGLQSQLAASEGQGRADIGERARDAGNGNPDGGNIGRGKTDRNRVRGC